MTATQRDGMAKPTSWIDTLRGNFSPLRIPNFRLYISGQAVSLVGTWLQITAQGWVVWQLSHSPAALGIVGMLNTLPILLLGPWAGVWADRLNRRRVLIGTQSVAMTLAFILAILTQTGLVQLWHVYVLATCLGIVTAIDFPAQQAFIGDLSGMSEVRRAVNVNAMVLQVSRMLGPALAGVVVNSLGASVAFWLNGLSFLAVIASLVAVQSAQAARHESGRSALGEFVDALGFVRRQPRLQDLIFFVILVTFFGLAVMSIMPAVASQMLHGGADTLGLLLAMSGAGALVATVVLVPIAQSARKTGLVVSGAVIWMGTCYVAVSFASGMLPLALLGVFCFSLGAPVVITMALGLLQVLAPPGMRARILSLFVMVSFGMQPIASLLIGYSASALGTPVAIRINGIGLILGGLAVLLLRSDLRQWEANRAVAAAESGRG